jgi:hypothetical protein
VQASTTGIFKRRVALAIATGTFALLAATRPALAAARCEIGDAIEGQEIHCFLKAKDGLRQSITVNSAFPTEVLFELTRWIGPCGKPATRTIRETKGFRGESKPLTIPVAFKTSSECAEVAFTSCQAAEAGASPETLKMHPFDCPAALELKP